ncbi:hypothetical protein ZTR_06133 [Talaromyces verruculosus]|nr:hypothetical protein ZTR_06133 [Talaromyces verruculosus]
MKRLDIMTLPSEWGQILLMDDDSEPSWAPEMSEFIHISDFMPDTVISSGLTLELLTQYRTPGLNDGQLQPSYYEEKNWEPLVKLLKVARRVEFLNYAELNNFPSSLLEALHQYHPTCYLNIWSTQNIAIDRPGLGNIQHADYGQFLDPFDLNLFHSPCLRAITLWYTTWRDLETRVLTGQEAIIPLVTMAQNLRHLQINDSYGRNYQRTNEFWQAYISSSYGESPSTPPQLLTLSLWSGALPSDPFLAKWGQYFQLSHIRALEVLRAGNVSEMSNLFFRLERLERLFITIDDGQVPASNLYEADYEPIFNAINPLKMLRVRGVGHKSTIYSILGHHGETLETLIIEPARFLWGHCNEWDYHSYPVFELDDIVAFAKMAPRLRELRLTVERSKGNLQEKQLYEALGLFPCLHSLIIDLEYKPRSSEALWLDDSHTRSSPSYQAALKDTLVNAAMDESLALQIWNVIYSKKQKENLHNLRHLRLVPIGWDLFDNDSERRVTFQLSRSFLISNREFLNNSSLEIREIGARERLLQWKKGSIPELVDPPEWRRPPKRLRRILRSLWGISESEIENWTAQWSSFPLDDV